MFFESIFYLYSLFEECIKYFHTFLYTIDIKGGDKVVFLLIWVANKKDTPVYIKIKVPGEQYY